MSKTIAVVNQKGGVGKTTSAVNLAAAVGSKGKSVLLVDIDPQGNATTGFGQKKSRDVKSIYDVIMGNLEPQDGIFKTAIEGLDIMPATIDLAGVEVEMVYLENREFRLKDAFNKIKNSYDYITIDCPPSLGLLTVNAFSAADSVVIPMQCDLFAV